MRQVFLWGLLALPISLANAAPCITAARSCAEWVTLAGGPAKSLIYRNYSLNTKNESVNRALVFVHGAGRDADNYFRTALAAAFLAGALENTIIVSPRFASHTGNCADALDPDEVNWPCSGDSWRSGGAAAGNDKLTSFDFADEILRKLARKDIFPNLGLIVVAGHSAGGQFVNRYEMANRVGEQLSVPVRYIASNPSSYAYLDNTRPNDKAYSVSARAPGYVPAVPANASASGSSAFGTFSDRRDCTTWDTWPYGLTNRSGYTAKLTDEELKKQFAARATTYLVGELDVLPLGGFDSSCPAMAQGPTRLARGEAYAKYANEKMGAHHAVVNVPLCGHNARCMFTSEAALPLLFPAK